MKNLQNTNPSAAEAYAKSLNDRVSTLEAKLKDLPTERLTFTTKANRLQYYYRTDGSNKAFYIPKSDDAKITALANAYYIRRVIPRLKKNISAVEKYISLHSGVEERDIFNSMPEDLQKRNSNLFTYKPKYINAWQSKVYTRNPYKSESMIHDTLRGEKVRSKSEAMIANALYNHTLPYHVECPLKLKRTGKIVYPDFTILNTNTLQEIYWEHFGMMGDLEYAAEACRRIQLLNSEGFKFGINLICTFESLEAPLSSTLVESYIRQYFD